MKIMRTVFLVSALAIAPLAIAAQPVVDEKAADMRAANLNRIEAYLSNLTTVAADFTQTSSDGSVGGGKFYLKRPGKMRWQYNPPTPILLVSDGKNITYHDAALDQTSYIGVDDTLAGFLTRELIKFDNESTQLTDYFAEKGVIRISLVQRKKPDEGMLTLEFSDNPIEIKKMITVDATGNMTTVILSNTKFGVELDEKLFTFTDLRGVNYKRNKRQ